MRLPADILKAINSMPEEKRQRVEQVVKRHVNACYRNGFPPENMERVYIEAIELVNLDERFPEFEVVEIERSWEPFRRYDQYVSPKAA